MKPELIIERIDFDLLSVEVVSESVGEGLPPKRNYYIVGPHLDAEIKNGNGRVYPRPIVEREVRKVNETKIAQSRFTGELNHPQTADINLERVSHLTKELRMEGNTAIGKSMLLNTPMGKIAQALCDGGVKLGVSSRGLGTLRESIVQNDYNLICVDIVSDPSGPNCFVSTVMENKEWVFENGILTEKERDKVVQEVEKVIIECQFSIEDRQAAFMKLYQDALSGIKQKHIS